MGEDVDYLGTMGGRDTAEAGPLKVLLIDDSQAFYEVIRDMLTTVDGRDYHLDWAATFDAGMEALLSNEHHVCLLDFVLGDGDGLALLREVGERGCSTPVVMLTGQGARRIDIEAIRAGATDYVEKLDVSPPVLERTIRHAIVRRRAEEALRQARDALEDRVRERTAELTKTVSALGAEIAERKRIEKALRESEARFRNLMEHLPGVAIQGYQTDGKVVFWNKASEEVYGYSADEAIGKYLGDLIIPEDIKPLLEKALVLGAEAENSGEFMPSGECDLLRKDGSLVPVYSIHTAVCVRGSANLLFCIDVDLSERKKVEDALRKSETEYRLLAENQKDVVLTISPEGILTYCSPALKELAGYEPEEVVGNHFSEYLTSENDRTRAELAIGRAFSEQVSGTFEFVLISRSGDAIPVEITEKPLVDAGKVVALQCVLRDVTERRRAEETAVRLAEAVEHAGEAILITDSDGSIQYVNPAFTEVTGYTREEALARTPRFLKSGEHDEAFYHALWATISSGEVWQGRMVNKRKDGTLYREDATISPVRDPSGVIVNYVSVNRDITKEVELEQQLTQAQKLESVGRLAGGVAHDFNNLLSPILGYAEMALAKLDPNDPMYSDFAHIRDAGQRATDLVRQLLAFGRKQMMAMRATDLNEVVTGVEPMLRRLIGEDIEVVARLASSLYQVTADHSQIEQVIMNLAVNARDAMPKGGALAIETANVVIDAERDEAHPGVPPGQYATFTVRDTGHGIDQEALAHIFEPFYTTKELGKGTGLGLATAYGIISQHKGHIRVETEPERGTAFIIYVPRSDAGPVKDTESSVAGRGCEGSETILVVEDEEMVRKLAGDVLAAHGYNVLQASHAQEALSLADKHPDTIHLLLTDVIMPQVNGKQLFEQLVKLREDLRVVFMSGYTDEVIADHGVLDAGIHFLQKPFSPRSLTQAVRDALDQ